MNQVWRYNSPLGEGEGPQRPPLIAESREEAEYILGRLGLDEPRLELDPGATLSVVLNPKMNRRELARFYRTLGRRSESGDNLVAAITQILDFLEDTVLLSSAIRLAILMRSGVPMGRAMKEAGFPEKDASAIMAMGEAGRIGEALESLADDHMRDHTLQSSISKVLMTPKIFLVIVTGVIWGSMTFMVPQMIGKLQEIVPKDKIPAFAMSAYHVGKWMNDNILISTLFFVGGLIGLFFFTRSKRFTQWMDNIKLVRELSMRVDMAAMWRSFAVLYEAGFNISQAAHIVADSARREDSESSFRGLGVLLASGVPLREAVKQTGFPRWVVSAVGSAASRDSGVPDGLRRFSGDLYEDADLLLEKIKSLVSTVSIIGMAFALILVFMVTYYPLLSAVLAQV